MFKKKKSLLTTLLLTMTLTLMLSSQASAETSPHFGKRLTTGVLNRYYYIDSYAASWFGSDIRNAVYEWNNTSHILYTSIWLMETSSQANSQFDVYRGYLAPSEPNTVVLGRTRFYTGSTEVNPMYNDWYWTDITIANATAEMGGSYPYPKATTSHEFGHAMGLAHQNATPSSIMAQTKDRDKAVTRAHYMDLYHINQLY